MSSRACRQLPTRGSDRLSLFDPAVLEYLKRHTPLSQWLECLCIVEFRADVGHRLSSLYPPSALTPDQQQWVTRLALPSGDKAPPGETAETTTGNITPSRATGGDASSKREPQPKECCFAFQIPGPLYCFSHFSLTPRGRSTREWCQRSAVVVTALGHFSFFTQFSRSINNALRLVESRGDFLPATVTSTSGPPTMGRLVKSQSNRSVNSAGQATGMDVSGRTSRVGFSPGSLDRLGSCVNGETNSPSLAGRGSLLPAPIRGNPDDSPGGGETSVEQRLLAQVALAVAVGWPSPTSNLPRCLSILPRDVNQTEFPIHYKAVVPASSPDAMGSSTAGGSSGIRQVTEHSLSKLSGSVDASESSFSSDEDGCCSSGSYSSGPYSTSDDNPDEEARRRNQPAKRKKRRRHQVFAQQGSNAITGTVRSQPPVFTQRVSPNSDQRARPAAPPIRPPDPPSPTPVAPCSRPTSSLPSSATGGDEGEFFSADEDSYSGDDDVSKLSRPTPVQSTDPSSCLPRQSPPTTSPTYNNYAHAASLTAVHFDPQKLADAGPHPDEVAPVARIVPSDFRLGPEGVQCGSPRRQRRERGNAGDRWPAESRTELSPGQRKRQMRRRLRRLLRRTGLEPRCSTDIPLDQFQETMNDPRFFAHSPELDLGGTLGDLLPSTLALWETVLCARPLLVFGTEAERVSQTVLGLRSLIAPLVFQGDCRPLVDASDPDFVALGNPAKVAAHYGLATRSGVGDIVVNAQRRAGALFGTLNPICLQTMISSFQGIIAYDVPKDTLYVPARVRNAPFVYQISPGTATITSPAESSRNSLAPSGDEGPSGSNESISGAGAAAANTDNLLTAASQLLTNPVAMLTRTSHGAASQAVEPPLRNTGAPGQAVANWLSNLIAKTGGQAPNTDVVYSTSFFNWVNQSNNPTTNTNVRLTAFPSESRQRRLSADIVSMRTDSSSRIPTASASDFRNISTSDTTSSPRASEMRPGVPGRIQPALRSVLRPGNFTYLLLNRKPVFSGKDQCLFVKGAKDVGLRMALYELTEDFLKPFEPYLTFDLRPLMLNPFQPMPRPSPLVPSVFIANGIESCGMFQLLSTSRVIRLYQSFMETSTFHNWFHSELSTRQAAAMRSQIAFCSAAGPEVYEQLARTEIEAGVQTVSHILANGDLNPSTFAALTEIRIRLLQHSSQQLR